MAKHTARRWSDAKPWGLFLEGCEFLDRNRAENRAAFAKALTGIPVLHEPHREFKQRVPHAIGLIRTGDTVQYANMILESA